MASLDTAIAQIEKIFTEAQVSPRLDSTTDRVKFVVEVRSRVITQLGHLNECLRTDAHLQAHPDVAKAFAAKLIDLRQRLAALQAKWRSGDMAARFDVYSEESAPVIEACADFLRWAKQARLAV